MIFPVKRLMIENDGYKREISLETIYINSTKVISITDYNGLSEFLTREGSPHRDKSFSLIKINGESGEIIALGNAQQIYLEIREHSGTKRLLND